MRKSIALFIMATLLLPMLTFAVPVNASTGHPWIGSYIGGTLQIATTSVDVMAGDAWVQKIDGATPAIVTDGNLTIIFAYNSTLLVDFSGAQFDLVMSKNGYSNMDEVTAAYLPGVPVSELNLPFHVYAGNPDYSLGTITNGSTTYKILTGPIPLDITNDYHYIKIYDGTSTLVAAAGIINILPGFAITPDQGAPCTTVTVNGYAVGSNTLYNFTYGHTFDYEFIGQNTSTADGKLVYTFQIGDKADNDWGSPDSDPIRVWINANDSVTEPEYWVLFWEYQSYFTNMTVTHAGDTSYADEFNNDTIVEMPFHCGDDVVLEGSYFCVSCGSVTIDIDGTPVATATLNEDGNFTAAFTIPAISNGNHVITVNDCSKDMTINITVYPTLLVTPEIGPIGTTVTFSACGFAANTMYYIYWYEHCFEEEISYNIINATTGPDGQFNVSTSYVVPTMIGGPHRIIAYDGNDTYPGEEVDGYPDAYAWTIFTVTPTMWIDPSTISNDCTTFTVYVNGLPVTCDSSDHYGPVYELNIDNQYFAVGAPGRVSPDACGNMEITLVAAGFRPGTHVASIYLRCPDFTYIDLDDPNYYTEMGWEYMSAYYLPGDIAPVAYACFTVDLTGDLISEQLASMNAMLVSINGSMATVATDLGQMALDIANLDARITAINDTVATISTNVGTIQTSLSSIGTTVTSISNGVATIQTSLGTLNGTVTSMNGDIATIKTDLGTVKANVASVKGFLPVDMTPVWIAVVLSLIAAIAAIYSIVVIRSKIAA